MSQPVNTIVHPDFLLQNATGRDLFHRYAENMPIFDYHCHLPAEEIYEDRKFANLTQIWLAGDHYKWRLMRANGVSEDYITGNASDYEKFMKWAETIPAALRNPIYHWTHLELKFPFGCMELLNPSTAEKIYRQTEEQLQQDDFSVRGLMRKFNVKTACTTDDPADSLEFHEKIKKSGFEITVSMAFRPDKAMNFSDIEKINAYIDKLAAVQNVGIADYQTYCDVLYARHQYFHDHGCRLSDHGLEFPFPIQVYSEEHVAQVFAKARMGKELTTEEQTQIMANLLFKFACWNYEKGWVQQFHVGALRGVNKCKLAQIGADCGVDSIHDFSYARSMGLFLNRLEENGTLTKTVLYNLNPRDCAMVATMAGNFQDGKIAGKMQYGPAWWFLDNKDGMEQQMNILSAQGLLSRFIGMTTDSRSFLSYSRHDYFRRILCNMLGKDVESGEIPYDEDLLKNMIEGICYNNAAQYFTMK